MKKLLNLFRLILRRKLFLTFLAWAAFISLAGWVWVALGWWLLGKLWWHELVVPHSVLATVRTMLFIILWTGVVLSFFMLWSHYNYKRYFIKGHRQHKPLEDQVPPLHWNEATFDPMDLKFEIKT
ncbi:hypothetical protein Dred_1594 [Desulforamulus reducens MI-1]|uniref:Uncharacterized protein n=1 Tax=Desulforamulus reducens (strain ATCC BAA-1160 / DSM 100696 / MI-1) TaxID=349161 RepID=A4J4W9_DESRM|nr:hypothetical protein [Desulforamulus reducens]ABO50122.1 hypothetical protein Dred_1594 [Desulforamulus reducens MI-1]